MKLQKHLAQLSKGQKTFLLVLVLILFLISMSRFLFASKRTGPFGTGLPSPMKTFIGNNVKFSIDYPSSWVANELPQGNHGDEEVFAVIINPGWWMPSVWFARHEFQEGKIDSVAQWGDSRIIQKRPTYKSISLTNIQTQRFDGLLRQYTWSEASLLGTSVIRCEDFYVLNNKVGYAVSFCSEDKDWQNTGKFFEQMIDSFDLH